MPNRNKAQRKEAQKILKIFRKSRKRSGTDEKEKNKMKIAVTYDNGNIFQLLWKNREL